MCKNNVTIAFTLGVAAGFTLLRCLTVKETKVERGFNRPTFTDGETKHLDEKRMKEREKQHNETLQATREHCDTMIRFYRDEYDEYMQECQEKHKQQMKHMKTVHALQVASREATILGLYQQLHASKKGKALEERAPETLKQIVTQSSITINV